MQEKSSRGSRRVGMIAVYLAYLATSAALAQTDAGGVTESAYLSDPGMVLSGARLRQEPGDSPVAVTVIDREMIEASGAREIQELFRLVPGMVVTYSFGHWPTVSLGFGAESYSRRIEVLIDGRSVYTPTFGGVMWPSLPYSVSDIDRIEVTRGPNSSSFGTNAFLGTINIITRDPTERTGGELEILGGDDYVNRLQIRRFGSTARSDWSISAAQWGDNGFDNQRRQWDGKSHRFINGQVRYQTRNAGIIHLRTGYETGSHDWGRSNPRFEPPHQQYWENLFGQFNWEYRTDGGSLLEFQFQHSEESTDERFPINPRPAFDFARIMYDESRASERTDLELQVTQAPTMNSRFVWGLGAREDVVQSPKAYFRDEPASNTFLRTFGQVEWLPTRDLTVNLGGMVENEEITGTSFSPRIGLNYGLTTGNTIRVAASRANRSPVLIAEHGDWYIDFPGGRNHVVRATGGLQREVVDSVEIGHLFRSSEGRFRIDTRLHHDHIRNLIMYTYPAVPDDTVDGFAVDLENTDDARITGLETGIGYESEIGARLHVNYAYKDIDSSNNAADISRSTPRHNVSLLASYPLNDRTDLSLKYFHYSSYNILDLRDGGERTDRLDLRLAHRLSPEPNSTRLALVIQSVTGDYRESRPRNLFERRIFGEIRIPF